MAKVDISKAIQNNVTRRAFQDLEAAVAKKPADTPQSAYQFLPLDAIEPDPDQPRRISGMSDGDDPHGLEELAGSILAHGIIQPITVRSLGGGRYRIVTGERRWRAAKIALQTGEPCRRKGYDLARIPAVLVTPESEHDRLEMQMVENLARADMTPLDTARALQKLLDQTGVSVRELARRLGRSLGWVQQILNIASPEAQEVSNRIGVSLDEIGQRDLMRMKSWLTDGRQAILEAVRVRIAQGEPYTRALLDEEADRYNLESALHLRGRGLPLGDLRILQSWQADPEKAAALARVQGGMSLADALASTVDRSGTDERKAEPQAETETPTSYRNHEQNAVEDSGNAGGFEDAPEHWNPETDRLEPEIDQPRFERQDASDPVASPYTAVEQASRGRSDSITIELPGELIALIFEKAGLARPLDLDRDTLLDALGRALS
ncbi:ParB/RepB/Spo0J family partition protein [Acidithiobacillus caldus]|uniref:ParB/RepB/Spo0J family partition protein n=1 Tax=Acidithiobacillus caldus TaxID=33059 RepID=UPI001C0769CF|nr:ParB/RepB/Spo0J family partition protein [Acidithiobacillus caldus]MBU2764456.1 ParB/RepB/Spo0J family partition protein [Acidithiobacillus caldus]